MNQPSLEHTRHTLAHLLAAAVIKKYPHAKLTLGPAIENGFYYDIDFSGGETPGDNDLMKLENLMRNILPSWTGFTHKEVSANEARTIFADNPFKLELINEISERDEKITIYTVGDFTDLCRGGHSENPAKEIASDSFSLDKIAGAYWRGSEKNPMLTRIYGLAFASAKELGEYRTQQEEAKKRDHRLLNEKHDYFMISEDVGKGLPLYLPNGAYIRKKLEDFIYEKELSRGYKYVYTPVLTHKRLYEQSGHLGHYHEDMYSPISIEDEEYYLRPMNCPHHHQIFRHRPLSYRDLPLRLAEFGLVHRFERSGVLTGLIRARCFTQNDAHIYCEKKDLKKELLDVLALFKEVYNDVFSIQNYWFRLSLPDFENTEKFGDVENRTMWDEATESARAALQEFGAQYVEGGGEAAFYGPKIDVQIRNVNGKEDTIATVQIDFYSANRFDLVFTNSDGQKEKPVIIHRAIMGSFERFFAFLIEQYAGAFPTWLAPIQVMILPVSEKHQEYAQEVADILRANGIQIEIDNSKEMLGKKVRAAKTSKVPYFLVLGDKEVRAQSITVENRNGEKLDISSVDTFLAALKKEINTHSRTLISKEKTG